MNIQELEHNHQYNICLADKSDYLLKDDISFISHNHTKLSIEFAISVLESIDMSLHLNSEAIYSKRQQKFIENKIQELKQYLK